MAEAYHNKVALPPSFSRVPQVCQTPIKIWGTVDRGNITLRLPGWWGRASR